MTKLLNRAEALHLGTGMHWSEAERLALSEIGVDDAAITELVGECATLGTESLLTGDEICDFARAVLVHGSALQVALSPGDQADMRQLLRMAETVRAWMGDGCNPDEIPKPQLAALAEWAGSVASGILTAAPQPPNFCEACAMDLATCDCASPRPAVVVRKPPNAANKGPARRDGPA